MFCKCTKIIFKRSACMLGTTKLRSLGSIRENANQYQQAAASKSKGKSKLSSAVFFSCEKSSLFDEDDSVLVIDIITPPPELNLFTGIFNHLFDHLDLILVKAESNVSALSWSDALNISRSARHGGKFNGNPVKKLLSSTGTLETILKEANVHESCLSLVAVLHAFKEVVDKCFGKHVVPGYKEAICSLSQLYH